MYKNQIIGRFDGVKQTNKDEWMGKCPLHSDHIPSVSFKWVNGKMLINCFAGCDTAQILKKVGLSFSDLYEDSSNQTSSRFKDTPEREHVYKNADGEILAKKVIYRKSNGSKSAVWYRYDKGNYIPKLLPKTSLPPYRVEKLKGGSNMYIDDSNVLLLPEGEKDVETLERLGYKATTSPYGANTKGEYWITYKDVFKDYDIVILSDNDAPGVKYGETAARALVDYAKSVRLINATDIYHDVPSKGDISDIDNIVGDDETKRFLCEAIDSAEVYVKRTSEPSKDELVLRLMELDVINKYSCNDRGMSKLFTDLFGGNCKYDVTHQVWMVFNGKYWEEDASKLLVYNKIKTLYDALVVYSDNIEDEEQRSVFLKKLKRYSYFCGRKALADDAQSDVIVYQSDFDKNPDLYNCLNGTLDLRTGVFSSHKPEDLISKISNVWYDPEARSELFEDFVSDIMQGDQERITYLQKIMGYSLTGNTNLETSWIFYGSSCRNGKSTLIETFSYMLGRTKGYAVSVLPQTLAQKNNKSSQQPSSDVARIEGARMMSVSEPADGLVLNIAFIKTLLGRDTIVARKLYANETEFIPQAKLFISTNHLPKVTDDTLFASRRVNVVPFNRHFTEKEQDLSLKQRLTTKNNISGIFNWCCAGLKKYYIEGAEPPEMVVNATKAYRANSDVIGKFLRECTVKKEKHNLSASSVYDEFTKWCQQSAFDLKRKSAFLGYLREKRLLSDTGTVDGRTVHNVLQNRDFNDDYLKSKEDI